VLRGQKLAANLWVNTNGGLSMPSLRDSSRILSSLLEYTQTSVQIQ
jgi:hypothetical protein